MNQSQSMNSKFENILVIYTIWLYIWLYIIYILYYKKFVFFIKKKININSNSIFTYSSKTKKLDYWTCMEINLSNKLYSLVYSKKS